jgi:hypothetical protein
MLDAYLETDGGVIRPATPPMVTGYDFLRDVALAVQAELEAGTAIPADTLITPEEQAPGDPAAWTADDLRSLLLDSRHDLIFLAGHFSASGALAADFTTRMTAAELAASDVDLHNAIVVGAGCHVAYNIVDADGIPVVTEEPDWAKAAAEKGLTLLGGTGYQYADTDFILYAERLYLLFSQQLRTGAGPVSIGEALTAAKVDYLAETQQVRGIDHKTLVEATIFGLPMLSVDMPGAHLPDAAAANTLAVENNLAPFAQNPGATLGLNYSDRTLIPQFEEHNKLLKNIRDGSFVNAFYLSGSDGVVSRPSEIVLPLETVDVTEPGTVLRGVGFRRGTYTDLPNVLPLTGAPNTEIRGVHTPFPVDYTYPVLLWRANYFKALAEAGGATSLVVTPAQFWTSTPGATTGTLRRYDSVDFRLYYSDNVSSYGDGSIPALSAPPAISQVTAVPMETDIYIRARVVGNPAAGIQEVWVTYTGTSGPYAGEWASFNLVQNPDDSTLWEGMLPLNGSAPEAIRFLVQAVNGVGLVSMSTNLAQGHQVDVPDGAPPVPTSLSLQLATPASGPYSTDTSATVRPSRVRRSPSVLACKASKRSPTRMEKPQ